MTKSKQKRLRIFAGPNGSGKSILSDILKGHKNERIKIGVFVNADEIEKQLKETGSFRLNDYEVKSTEKELQLFVEQQGMSPIKMEDDSVIKKFEIKEDAIFYRGEINSYIAADIASFLRTELLLTGVSFSFETVFSHESKLELMSLANSLGYKVYLYFITTKHPDINIDRVKLRVKKGGHPVPEDRIVDRYHKAMNLLLKAMIASYRAYLFDNSGKRSKLIAQVEPGNTVEMSVPDEEIPAWFHQYVFDRVP